jgi:hypothetical protein
MSLKMYSQSEQGQADHDIRNSDQR